MAVDEVRVHRADAGLVEAEPARGRHAQVVVVHVSVFEQRVQRGLRFGRLEVERDAALAALTAEERPLDPAHAFTARRFHLDHVGAEVAQQHRRERAGQERTRVDHSHALERVLRCGTGRRRVLARLPLAQHLVGVLAEGGRERPHARRRIHRDG